MTDADVGKLVNEHFAAGFQKVGTFQVISGRKVGGNVATYFCTAEGRVLHAIAGPVGAAVLLREAKWVLDIHEKAKRVGKEGDTDYTKFVRQAHIERLQGARSASRSAANSQAARVAAVHRLLAEHALDDIEKVYPKVWEGILKEKRSDEPVKFR